MISVPLSKWAVGYGKIFLLKLAAQQTLAVLRSQGLASALFVALLMLTYLGTLYQVEHGVLQAQQKYFHSYVVVQPVYGFAVLLPGAQLLMMLLFVNILLGALPRMRRGLAQVGMLMVHGGILLLLLGAYVSHHFGISGEMTLHRGEARDYFELRDQWELLIRPTADAASAAEVRVPWETLQAAAETGESLFRHKQLPFELRLSGFLERALMMPVDAATDSGAMVVEGQTLVPLPEAMGGVEAMAGVSVVATRDTGGASTSLLLLEGEDQSLAMDSEGGAWHLLLQHPRVPLPFSLRLDAFERELHPGTDLPRAYSSTLTRQEGTLSERAVIKMNEPMRHAGYTFYQSSWGPQGAADEVERYSILAVSRNPAERVPLYACVVVTLGMVLHFIRKLYRHVRHEPERRGA